MEFGAGHTGAAIAKGHPDEPLCSFAPHLCQRAALMGTFHALRGLNARLQALFMITLVFRTGTLAFPFYAAYLIHQHAISAGTAGLLVGVYGAGALCTDLIIGAVIKRFSANRVILGSLLFNAVLLLVIPSVDNLLALFLLSFLWGPVTKPSHRPRSPRQWLTVILSHAKWRFPATDWRSTSVWPSGRYWAA